MTNRLVGFLLAAIFPAMVGVDSASSARAGTASTAPTIESGWLAGLTGRSTTLPPGCSEPPSARPPIADYPVCHDQIRLFADRLEAARRSGRLLVIEFGATWCPSCRGLKQALRDPALFGPDLASGSLTRDMVEMAVGLSTIARGRMTAVDSGEAILARLFAATPASRMRAYPLIAVIDPADPARAVVRNLDDLVLDGTRVPAGPLARLLTEARDHLRRGTAPPDEPGWIMRKLSRLWQRLW